MSNDLEVDEAQRGHRNDGYNLDASHIQAIANPPDPRQSQHGQSNSQGVVQLQHNSYRHNTNSRPSTFVSASESLPNPHARHPREGFTLAISYSTTSSASSPQLPLSGYAGAEYNPYEEQIYAPGSRPQSQFELASYNSQGNNVSAGNASVLPSGCFSPRSTLVGSFAPGPDCAPSETNSWYGQAPQGTPRRHNTIKTVELFNGNFVLDSPVPSKLLSRCSFREGREFTRMRYTAATCDPDNFKDHRFDLRQSYYDPPRCTELFIVITMYNENEVLFCRTMESIMENIAKLCKRGRSETWGKDGWKKVVVCIVSDGRQKINPRTLDVLAAMGVYQEGVAKNMVNNREVTAHIYEYTTQVCVTPSMKIVAGEKGIVPVQIIFCLKEKNQKKINSHRWFFNAFAPILNPNVCVLLDVGTRPSSLSIYHLWKAFDVHKTVGGACGEIIADKGKYGQNLLQPLVAAQNFEYKMSNILDKPLESIFGYITVLPGAFSAYRYSALRNENGDAPLQKYFLGETMHGAGTDIFTANMYLAEDRILCWELVSKQGEKWLLHYVKSARAHTDVPDGVPELISQRRRWLNGSFFAAVHSIVHFSYIYRSKHSTFRKFWLHIELLYQLYNFIFSWFALGNYYIAFTILTQGMESYLPVFHYPNLVLSYFYLGLLIMCFILSLGNRPQGSKVAYTLAILGFSLITVYVTASAALLAYKGVESLAASQGRGIEIQDFLVNSLLRNIVLSLAATLGLYIVSSLLSFEPWHIITSLIPYLLMAPSYIAVFNVFAFANVHDVSWGTKGDNNASTDLGVISVGKGGNKVQVAMVEEKDIDAAYEEVTAKLSNKPPKVKETVNQATQQEDYYKTFRTNVLLFWTLSNALLAVVVLSIIPDLSIAGISSNFQTVYLSVILFSITGLALIRLVGSTAYLIVRLFTQE